MSRPDQLRIVGGTIHDPANGVDGEVRDICVDQGRIVASLSEEAPTLDVRGMVVMPAEWTSTPMSRAPAVTTPAGCCPRNMPSTQSRPPT